LGRDIFHVSSTADASRCRSESFQWDGTLVGTTLA
jgi:hypothetical protein